MQLDIFEDSRDLQLRNDVLVALERRDVPAARVAWQRFSEAFALDATLPDLTVLIDALASRTTDRFHDHDAVRRARQAVSQTLEPTVLKLFGASAGKAWLMPFWRKLAQRATPLVFHAEHSEDHAAALWLRASEWPAAIDAVAGIESWRRIPVPLAWMAEAQYRVAGLAQVWALLAELAWLSPRLFEQTTKRLADPLLHKLRKGFDANFEGQGDVSDLAWFPAWVLIEQAGLAALLAKTQASNHTAPEQALRLLVELLGLEHQGRHHDIVAKRKSLRDLHTGLYAAYMKTR